MGKWLIGSLTVGNLKLFIYLFHFINLIGSGVYWICRLMVLVLMLTKGGICGLCPADLSIVRASERMVAALFSSSALLAPFF